MYHKHKYGIGKNNIVQRGKKIVYLILHNNETFYYQIAFLRRVLSNDSLKECLEIINGKYENNDFATNSIEQMCKISAR